MRIHDIVGSELGEGVHDPHIFKAVFMAGSPGAGKTTIAARLFNGSGLKTLNLDKFWQYYNRKGKEKDLKKFWDRYHRQSNRYREEKLGLLMDGTGRRIDKIRSIKDELESIGYDTAMVYVVTDLETAIDRAKRRAASPGPDQGRTIPDDIIAQTWKSVQSIQHDYKEMFGDTFFVVDNSNTPKLDNVEKKIDAWLNAPPQNPIAHQWIQNR
jgi:adenylate kinase family enzyme